MSNKIYQGGFYNEYQKFRYLKTLPEKSVAQASRILSRARPIEEQYDIDLYNFSLHQVENLFNYLEPSTLNASRSNFYIVQNYIRWGIEQNLRDDNLNPIELFSDVAYFNRFIDQSKKALYTKDEIDEIVDTCKNAQDSLVIQLIFEGVFGVSGYTELLNLTTNDVLDNNMLRLKDGENQRTIQVSDKCIRLIEKAINEEVYYKKNGNASVNLKSADHAELVKNNYVLRNVKTRNKDDGIADAHLVLRRIKAIKEYAELKVLTPYIVRNSGMLYFAKKIYEEEGKFEKDQIVSVCQQFGIRKINNNGYEVYNAHRYTEDFLNVRTIGEVYADS